MNIYKTLTSLVWQYEGHLLVKQLLIVCLVVVVRLELWTSTLVKHPFSRTIWLSQNQNVSILDFTEAKDDEGGGDNWSYKKCKAPVKLSPPTYHQP